MSMISLLLHVARRAEVGLVLCHNVKESWKVSGIQGPEPLVAFGTPSSVPKGGRLPCRTTNLRPGPKTPCGLDRTQGSGHKPLIASGMCTDLLVPCFLLINMSSIISSSRPYSIRVKENAKPSQLCLMHHYLSTPMSSCPHLFTLTSSPPASLFDPQ